MRQVLDVGVAVVAESESWSEWHPLRGVGSNKAIPTLPGLYRIRARGEESLAYVGQTGRSLRGRLGQLTGAFGDVMPYNDPHTAAPGLWALSQDEDCEFECSFIVDLHDTPQRKAHECVEITKHRITHGHSPLLNFGRMPSGWLKSSGNNAHLVQSGARRRGVRDASASRSEDAPAPNSLTQAPTDPRLFGLQWTRLEPLDHANGVVGVYRAVAEEDVIYIGQGLIKARVLAHARKVSTPSRQADLFSRVTRWEFVALPGRAPQQLLEIENDLIAHHVIQLGRPPAAQFLG